MKPLFNLITPEERDAATKLYWWQHGGDSFTPQLYSLISKADPGNRAKLALAFPIEVGVFKAWYDGASEEEFYKRYGVQLRSATPSLPGTPIKEDAE